MPLTVSKLFDFEDLYKHRFPDKDNRAIVEKLKQQGLYDLQAQEIGVRWDKIEPPDNSGVYVVSLSDNRDENNNLKEHIPICETKIKNEWLKYAPDMTIDGKKASIENIKSFLSEFWLPKENILYIGSTNNLNRRVKQYYNQKLGKGNHKGGQWLHALSIFSKTFVYYVETVETDNYEQVEINLLQNFDYHVRKAGNNKERVLPFANLEMKKEDEKMHNKNKINGQYRMKNQY